MTGTPLDDRLRTVEDRLYAVAPSEFVRCRSEAAQTAKQDGDRELADAIASLRKPTSAAWALNAYARADGDAIEGLLGLGARLRDAVDRGDGEAIRQLMRERSRTVTELLADVRQHAEEHGEPLSASVAAQVEQSLRAAMGSDVEADVLRRGVLTTALEESGFGAMHLPGAGSAPRRSTEPVTDARAAHDDGLAAAEQRAAEATDAVERLERELDASSARRTQLEAERDQLRLRLDEVDEALRNQRDAEAETDAALKEARAALRTARASVRRAR